MSELLSKSAISNDRLSSAILTICELLQELELGWMSLDSGDAIENHEYMEAARSTTHLLIRKLKAGQGDIGPCFE